MNPIEKALEIALSAHLGQVDKAGRPYILHPLRVMMKQQDDRSRMAALLHDVVEDSSVTLEELQKEGCFPESVLEAVDLLTRREEDSYEAFVQGCADHPVARKVKLADLEDNMDIRRLDGVGENDLARLDKYLKAWRRLKEA